jgi:hypothetical protein
MKCSRTFTLKEAVSPTPDVYAYYALDEPSLSSEAVDQVSGYNMSWIGGVIVSTAGKIGTAFAFDGASPYRVQSNSSAHWDLSADSFTIRGWLYVSVNGAGTCSIVSNDNFELVWEAGSSMFRWSVQMTDVSTYDLYSGVITTGAWHRIVVWHEKGVGLGMKIDNDADITTPNLLSQLSGNHRLYIGAGSSFSVYSVDEVGIWKRILTAAELLTDWNSGNGKTYPDVP